MALLDKLTESMQRGKVVEISAYSGMRERMKEMIKEAVIEFKDEIIQELQRMMKEKIGEEGITTLKGERGYTPQRGVDYFTSQELEMIKNEIRPVKGKDYFDGMPGHNGQSPSLEAIQSIIKRNLPKQKDINLNAIASDLARAFEKLPKEKQLDYDALRNTPNIPQKSRKRSGGGGGGDTVNVQDLSASLDGSAKTFTVNVHFKAIMLVGTQFPQIYRPTTDFTTVGTQLTLTNEVGAPQAGQTLLFIYA